MNDTLKLIPQYLLLTNLKPIDQYTVLIIDKPKINRSIFKNEFDNQ